MTTRIYVDTSVIGVLCDDRVPERRDLTADFWGRRSEFALGTSEICREELGHIRDAKLREALLDQLAEVGVFPVTNEMTTLADDYVAAGVFSPAMLNDALHVAAAVLARYDVLVSWNFRHLVNRRRRAKVRSLNLDLGLPDIEILAPPEV